MVEAGRQLDGAAGPPDHRAARGLGGERAGQRGAAPVVVGQVHGHRRVGAVGVARAGRDDAVGGAEEVLGEGDGVDPEVEDRAAPERGVEEAGGGVVGAVGTEVGLDGDDLADLAGLDEAPGLHDGGLQARPHRLHAEDAPVAGGGHDLAGAGQGGGERLLDQHRDAGLDGGQGQRVVLRVRGGDVEDVDVGAHQVGVGVRALDAVRRGERSGPLAAARPDGHHLGVRHVLEVGDEGLRHAAGPCDAPPSRHGPTLGRPATAREAAPTNASRGPRVRVAANTAPIPSRSITWKK